MLVIGISGGTASGKTTIAHQIINEFPEDEVGYISQDSYYKSLESLNHDQRAKINFDHPSSIDFDLLIEHLRNLKANKVIQQPVYSFALHDQTEETITTPPKKVIIIEGILIFTHPDLRNLLDIKIFIDTDSDERLIRRLKRDISERGRDMEEVLNRYQTTIKPMHQQFIEPTKEYADIIISNNQFNSTAVELVCSVIYQKIL